MDKWVNMYTHFFIDWVILLDVVAEFYLTHLSSILFFIGLSLYVRALETDLKIQIEEIHRSVHCSNGPIDREFKRKLFNEIQFHARLYE